MNNNNNNNNDNNNENTRLLIKLHLTMKHRQFKYIHRRNCIDSSRIKSESVIAS